MKKMNSLAVKVPVILSLFTAVFITILCFIALNIASRGITKSRFEGFYTTVQGYSSVFDAWFRTQSYILEIYSSVNVIDNYLSDPSGNVNNLKNTLRVFREKNACSLNVGLVSFDGTILLDSDYEPWTGKKFSDIYSVAWNKIKNKEYGYGSVVYDNDFVTSPLSGDHSFLFVTPVIKNGKEVAYLYTIFSLKEFFKNYMSDVNLGKSGILIVFGSNDKIIMSSDYNLIGIDIVPEFKQAYTRGVDNGVIKNYHTEGTTFSAYYQKLKYVPWFTVMAMTDHEIYIDVRKAVISGIILGLITIISIGIFIVFFIRSITRPLAIVVHAAQKIENGDLREYANEIKDRKDEIGALAESFRHMRSKLVETITEVNSASENIMEASERLASGNLELSRRTEAQAANLEETAASMEEMASTIKSSTEYSVNGNEMMIASKSSIDDAGSIILDTTKNIEEVHEASSKIKDITKLIEDIAFQTNILALNASVEAARAGDMGKGFGVVASEVRNLAQTTQTSVKDITDLIDNVYTKIDKATETAHQSQKIFSDIKSKIDETANIMQGISSAAVEQQAGVEQVNRAVSEMDLATQKNSALVNEAESASRDLVSQANTLKNVMSFFKL